jgi:hypothetical protein
MVLMSEEQMKRSDVKPMARIVSYADAEVYILSVYVYRLNQLISVLLLVGLVKRHWRERGCQWVRLTIMRLMRLLQ